MLVGNTYLVRGDESAVVSIFALLTEAGIATDGNPDIYRRTYAHFGIDEARELSARAYSKSISGSRRAFIAITATITNEAQNALLKTLEEPPGDALFFLVVQSPETLLPTLRSRSQILDLASTAESSVEPRAFLAARPRERIEMLKPLLEKNEDDRRDIAGVIMFLSSLERMLGGVSAKNGAGHEGLDAVYRARKYAGDKGSLLKPLLEQVALLCPQL